MPQGASSDIDIVDGCILLASLLLGAGYSAFCIYGKADYNFIHPHPKEMTENRESSGIKSKGLLTLPVAPSLESKFDSRSRLGLRQSTRRPEEPYKPRVPDIRDYMWVWISPGKRGIENDLFLDIVTGQVYQPSHSHFISIDSVWTDSNMWIHIHAPARITASSLNLTDHRIYEPVLSDPRHTQIKLTGLSTISVTALPHFLWPAHPKLVETHRQTPGSLSRRHVSVVNSRFSYEYFPPYRQLDGLVARCVSYCDRNLEELAIITEFFEHRRDKLTRRSSNVSNGSVEECFDQGRDDSMQFISYLPGISHTVSFYDNRLDGLRTSQERIGVSFYATYAGRPDQLLSLRADFATSSRLTVRLTQSFESSSNTVNIPLTDSAVAIIDFAREITFDYVSSQITLTRHGSDGGIGKSLAIFNRDNGTLTPDTRSQCQHFTMTDSRVVSIQGMEKAAIRLVEESLASLDILLQIRMKEEVLVSQNPSHSTSLLPGNLSVGITDNAAYRSVSHIKNSESDIHSVSCSALDPGPDLLKVYLLEYRKDTLEKHEAEEVLRKAKDDLKQRLLERASLINSRIAGDKDLLSKRMTVNANRLQEGLQPDHDFAEFTEETSLRISILEQSLARYEAHAFGKFEELERYLSEDPRLRNLWS